MHHVLPNSNSASMSHNCTAQTITNWAGIHSCTPKQVHYPDNHDDVRKILRDAKENGLHVKVFGSARSPSDIAMTDDVVIMLDKMNKLLIAEFATQRVKVQAGMTLHALHVELDRLGLSLSVLSSISDQTYLQQIG